MRVSAAILVLILAGCGKPEGSVFLGDSITKNWADTRISRSWPEVQRIFPGAINAGYPGENAAQIEVEFAKLGVRPERIHILAGTNDDLRGSPSLAVDAIERLAIHVERNGGHVIIGTIPPYDAGKFWQAAYAESYNEALKRMAAKHGYQVADYYAAMILPSGAQNPALFDDSGIHPNAEGYKVMEAVLATVAPQRVSKLTQ